ncbi:MAG: hypothetical protein RIG61_07180 [Deltaproteobacteria bacterium]
MKLALISALIFMLSFGLCFAEQGRKSRDPDNRMRLGKRVITPMAGKYSKMLGDIISTADSMGITDAQKQKLSEVRKKYVVSLSNEENELKKLHFQIMKKIEDPSFDPEELKKEIKEANAINNKASNNFVDALVIVRDALGKEMYEQVNKSIEQHEQDLIQLRRKQIMKLRSQKMKRQPDPKTEESGEAKSADTEKSSADKQE